MGDVDAGNVKAKASIEYDPSGAKQMKEDLASIGQAAGGLGESTGQASEKMAGLGAQMSSGAESARGFSSALSELPKITESGTSSISQMSGVLAEQRSVVEEASAAQETLSKQVETTVSTFEKAAPSIQSVSEHTQKLSQSVQAASESISSSTSGWSASASENMAVFEDSLVNPYPFQMINQHLVETGQTWGDFTSSIGKENTSVLNDMATYGQKTYDVLGGMSSQIQATGQTFIESATGAEEFTKQFNGVADSTASASKAINEFGGVGDAMYGPEKAVSSLSDAINEFGGVGEKLYGPMPAMKSVGFGAAFGEAFNSIGGFLNDLAMPLMAVQMIGMAVGQVGQAMYDSAAIAEGPAAHSFGTFTGTVDALGQSLQRAGGQFSEGFGQALLPTLNALNNQAGSSDLGGLGQFAGGVASTLANLTLITTGVDPLGGMEGLVNQGASLIGLQQPFQGPAPVSQYQQQMMQMPQTIRQATQQTQYQANLTMEEAVDPGFLAAQQQAQAAQTIYQRAQQRYNTMNPVNLQKMASDAQYNLYAQQQAENYQYQMNNPTYGPVDIPGFWGGVFANNNSGSNNSANRYGSRAPGQIAPSQQTNGGGGIDWGGVGGFFSGIGKSISDFWNTPNGGADTLGMLFSPQAWGFGGSASTGGCFVAGTPVLLADGSEKPIETLRVDDQVLAHDGEKQVPATIIGCISFPAKQTYELVFDNGRTLTTTDSHPLAGEHGWKSISPESTAQENPGLPVTTLQVGDRIYTANGALCRLLSIQQREITTVYNITVDASHTYYANGVLVHNAKAQTIGSGSLANDGTGSQQVQVSHTFVANVQWEANNLQKQFTGAASWVGQNLANTFQGAASWVGQNLANTFQGAASWVGSGLANTFNGVASWVGTGLSNTFQGVADWIGSGLSNTFHGAADWVGTGLSNTFKGVASWIGQGLEHTFTGIANWNAQNLNPTFTVNPSVTMLAEGTSNWGGGPAMVGEGAYPEVVEHNGQYSLFDRATLLNLPTGANVYPMKNLQGSGVAQFADGTMPGQVHLINLGVNQRGAMPESISVNVHLDSQTILSAIEMPFAQNIRVANGDRSY